jgi:uncharacterized radical SAM superfamily Fe-S cluster-containing enzyme
MKIGSRNERKQLYSHTTAICPVCNQLVPARIVENDGRIRLEKLCPVDGISDALICSDPDWYRDSRAYVKPGQSPLGLTVGKFNGCPDSCGLCPEHRQHTCLPVVEITNACNMSCPVCLKDLKQPFGMGAAEYRSVLEKLRDCEGSIPVINLSGGEPTVHPDFEKFIRISGECGVMQTTVSTNGLRLLEDSSLRDLFRDTGTIAALQFDGFKPATWQKLRGCDLSAMKLKLIEVMEAEGIRYSLTATVMNDVNDHEITAITDYFFASKAVSLMFQPVACTGTAMHLANENRLTIPDVVHRIEKSRFVKEGDFNPLPCSHYSCFALSYYLKLDEEKFLSLKEFLGREQYLDVIANRTLPGLDEDGYALIKERIYDFWSAADSSGDNEKVLQRIRTILRELSATPFSPKRAFELGSASMKGVFIHHFMDNETFDLGRLMKCCNHYPQADGRLVPICAYNNHLAPRTAS